ncbi:MAG: PKD domain-containing protein [Xanthomonadaceae bacterium]|nr:PKD domain-containing protein [Xanthomonadaceae bacterium]MDE1885000.1 PKD domain-containing protein [Xanthomonadaceae bacterium]MDE1961789.1 PKD domain-containing protein [Xanthomonadaceae bacterium]MDE2084270.1 PKD domain-containing protein [Xanthomonadaceae bacterium]MDE2258192.1 PKD domain-containing protein [Xanthomonadaceae bacterium]
MIAEIPDPACVGAGSPFAADIQNTRGQFDAKYTATTSFQTANIPVQLTGVGMFDFLHGQTGVAPNGIELHPVLGIVFNPSGGGTPDFALTAAPQSVSVNQGASASTTVTVTPSNGFASAVSFSASGLPSGVTASFSPASSAASTTLTLTASSTAAAGAATVIVTGTSGSLSHTTTVNLTVVASGGGGSTAVYNSTLLAPECASVGASCDSGTLLVGRGTLSGGAEPNQPNTINNSCADGNSGTFHSDESDDRIVISSTDGGPLTAGKTAQVSATVWAYSTADALDLYSAADATNPSWTFLSTITPSAAGAQTLSTTFTLPAGGLQAVRAHFRYQGSASPCSTGSYDESDDLIFAVSSTAPAPDFSIAAAPASLGIAQGASGTSTVTVSPQNGFGGSVALSASGLPSGVTASFSPASTAGSSTLTLSASATAATGTSTMTITGTSGSLTHTTALNLTVNAAATGGTPTASFTDSVNGLAVAFTDTSTDSGGTISSWSWNFGDGSASATQNPSHTYTASGTYSVTETVTDGVSGKTSTATHSVTVSGGGGSSQLLGNTGFESGAASPWTMSSGILCSNSSCSGESAHAGSWFVWLDGYGTTHTDTLAQTVTIPAGKTSATLQYYLHIDTAETTTSTAYDKLNVQVYSSSGTLLKTIRTFSNLNAASGYAVHTDSLAAYIGQTVRIQFTGTEDSSNQTSFVLDDVTLTVQ